MANPKQTPAYPAKVRQKRYFLVDKAGKTVKEVCRLYFISKKTYYKWRAIDSSNREHVPKKEHPQTKLKGEIKIFVCEEKKRINYGPRNLTSKETIDAFEETEKVFPFKITEYILANI